MTDTPRTDGEEYNTSSWDDPNNEMVVHADFARQLERELNAALAKVALLEERLEFFIGDSND